MHAECVCVHVHARACMRILRFLHIFTFFFLFCVQKIIMLHKARYIKKMESERGGGADQKKTTSKPSLELSTSNVDYIDC